MAYFNNSNNTDFYSASSASGELDAYPFLNQASAIEEAGGQGYCTCAECQSTVGRPLPMVGSPTSLRANASFGKYHCSTSLIVALRAGLQTQWPRPHRTRPWPTGMTNRHIPGTTGSQSANSPSTSSPDFRAGPVPSLPRWGWKYQLRSQPPVLVRILSLLKPRGIGYSPTTNSLARLLGG